MNLFSRSIVFKLWLVMVMLVLIVLYFTGLLQTGKLKEMYYAQQVELMTSEAVHIAASQEEITDRGINAHYLAALADALGGNIMVTDQDGNIDQCIGMSMNMRNVGGMKINIAEHHDIPLTEQDIETVLRGETVSYRGPHLFLDTSVLTVAAPVYSDGKVNGIVVLNSPLEAVEERVTALQMITRYAGLAGIILATFLSLVFSRTLSRPLLKMNQAARAMSRGDYSRRVEVKSGDEIGLLAESLNSLAAEIQEKIEALERLDRTRNRFVANVSHELRTPLSIIQGYTEALIDGMARSEEERRKYLGNIHEEILRLRRLVTEILDLRKIKAGRLEMNMLEINLAATALRVAGKFAALAKEKNIYLYTDIPPKLSPASADPDRLEQVFINLLDNAVRFTPAGGVIRIGIRDLNDKFVVFVSNSGSGIPPDEQHLIWERFYKVDKSRTRAGGGTGLGLAIVKEIIEAHGGTVNLKSAPGKETVFEFTLPKVL